MDIASLTFDFALLVMTLICYILKERSRFVENSPFRIQRRICLGDNGNWLDDKYESHCVENAEFLDTVTGVNYIYLSN